MPFPQAKDLGQPSREALWRSGTQISNHRRLLRARRERPRHRCAAEQRDKLTASIKKTRSHGTIAKRVGLAKRLRSAKGLPFSSSRIGCQRPVRNSFDHLVGAGEQRRWHFEAECLRGLELDNKFELVDLFDRQVTGFGAASEFMAMHPQLGVKNKRSSLHRQQTKPTTSPGALQRSIDRLPSPFPNHFFWW